MKWLKGLISDADQVVLDGQPEFLANAEVEEGETVVGELSDDLKKLYTLFMKRQGDLTAECRVFHREAGEMIGRTLGSLLAGDKNGGLAEADFAKMAEHNARHADVEIIRDIFWHCVRRTMAISRDAEVVALRKGWKVVTSRSNQRSGIELIPVGLGAFLGLRG